MEANQKIVKFFGTEIKSVNAEQLTATAIVSTKKTDRDGDVITPESFKKRLKTYKDHPVLLSSHFYHDLKSQIGEAKSIKITDDGLEVEFKYYAGEGNDQADWAFNLAQKGIAAFSIGFMGWEYDWIKEKDKDGVERVTGRKYTDVELLEISQVLVPSNRGALQSGRSMLAAETEVFEMAAKAFGDGVLTDVEPKAQPEKKADEAAPEMCKCEILNMKGVTDNKCAVCEKEVAADKQEAIKKFCIALSGTGHYTESILPKGANGSLPSAKELSDAVREQFKQ